MLGTNDTAAENADTSLLYAGEQYDSNLSHYYLRARYYNPFSGTFNRIDPFTGNNQDPQSLHKYAYVHNNPINGIDPMGEEFTLPTLTLRAALSYILLAILLPAAVAVWGLHVYGPPSKRPTLPQQLKIDAARTWIDSLAGLTYTLSSTNEDFYISWIHADFDNYFVSEKGDFMAKAIIWPSEKIILNNKEDDLACDWFRLTPEEGAAVMIHELYHKAGAWPPGPWEEKGAWELEAKVGVTLNINLGGIVASSIRGASEELGFELPDYYKR